MLSGLHLQHVLASFARPIFAGGWYRAPGCFIQSESSLFDLSPLLATLEVDSEQPRRETYDWLIIQRDSERARGYRWCQCSELVGLLHPISGGPALPALGGLGSPYTFHEYLFGPDVSHPCQPADTKACIPHCRHGYGSSPLCFGASLSTEIIEIQEALFFSDLAIALCVCLNSQTEILNQKIPSSYVSQRLMLNNIWL